MPAALIGHGISTIYGHRAHSSYDAKSNINHLLGPGRHTHANDFPQFVPYLELDSVLLAGVESQNNRINLGLFILKSEVITVASVSIACYQYRPTRRSPTDFPSGHTS